MLDDMQAIGHVRVSTDRQAEHGVSLEAQESKIRAMSTIHSAELLEVIVDGGESAESLNRPGVQRLLALINSGQAQAVIVAKLDRLTRSVKDLCNLLELFEKRKGALISVAGRLVITIMAAVSMGAGGDRETHTGCASPQAQSGSPSGQYPVRLPAGSGRPAPGAGCGRTGRAAGNQPAARRGQEFTWDRRHAESPGVPHKAGDGVAARISSAHLDLALRPSRPVGFGTSSSI